MKLSDIKLSDYARQIILTICFLAVVFIAASAIVYRSTACLPFVLGVLAGSAVSVAKAVMLDQAINRTLGMQKQSVGGYLSLQHLLRLLLTGAVLLLGALVDGISIWGVAAGIFTFQISLYVHQLFSKKK